MYHCPGRGPNSAWDAPPPPGLRSNVNEVHPSFAGVSAGYNFLLGYDIGMSACKGLHDFFTRFGVTCELCRDETNVSGGAPPDHPVHPRWGSDERCYIMSTVWLTNNPEDVICL